ncbi:MAG: hypothetical protein ACPGUV_10725 [Polyangiales bacterium]
MSSKPLRLRPKLGEGSPCCVCMLGLLWVLMACGGAAGPKVEHAEARPEPTVAGLLPPDMGLYGHVDVHAVKASPHAAQLQALLAAVAPPDSAAGALLQGLWQGAATLSWGAAGQDAAALLVAMGQFDAKLAQAAVALSESGPWPPAEQAPRQVEGWQVWTGRRSAAALYQQKLWVWGPVAVVEARLRADDAHQAASDKLQPALKGLHQALTAGDATFDALLVSRLDGRVGQEIGQLRRVVDPAALQHLRAFGARASLRQGLALLLRADGDDAASAAALAAQLQGRFDRLARNIVVRALGLASLLRAVQVQASGPSLSLALDLDLPTSQQLLQRLQPLAVGALRRGLVQP